MIPHPGLAPWYLASVVGLVVLAVFLSFGGVSLPSGTQPLPASRSSLYGAKNGLHHSCLSISGLWPNNSYYVKLSACFPLLPSFLRCFIHGAGRGALLVLRGLWGCCDGSRGVGSGIETGMIEGRPNSKDETISKTLIFFSPDHQHLTNSVILCKKRCFTRVEVRLSVWF